jgi:hypothetical protein
LSKFREDLCYRLCAFPIEVPPLRDRPSDIPRLVRFFLGRAARNLAKPHLVLTPEVEKVLLAHGWPGNVRELENTMEQVAILCDDVIKPDDLPVTSSGPARPVLFRDIECQAIDDALRDNDGNRTRGVAYRPGRGGARNRAIEPSPVPGANYQKIAGRFLGESNDFLGGFALACQFPDGAMRPDLIRCLAGSGGLRNQRHRSGICAIGISSQAWGQGADLSCW